jgi:hypothetical protein
MKVYTGMEQVESNCLNRLLYEVLGCASAIILIIFFCRVKIFPL